MSERRDADPRSSDAPPLGLRRPGLAVVAVLLQAAPGYSHALDPFRQHLVLSSGVLVAAWFALNLAGRTGVTRRALAVALFGAGLNLAVMLPNGGMPVSAAALAELGQAGAEVADGHLYKHQLADADTILAPLGDVIPVRPLGMVASVGDIVLLVGLVWTLALVATRAGSRAWSAPAVNVES